MTRTCKYCKGSIEGKRVDAKYCSDNCRKSYWAKFIEPRAICDDCGTALGINSIRNIRRRRQQPLCASCTQYRRSGTGRGF